MYNWLLQTAAHQNFRIYIRGNRYKTVVSLLHFSMLKTQLKLVFIPRQLVVDKDGANLNCEILTRL